MFIKTYVVPYVSYVVKKIKALQLVSRDSQLVINTFCPEIGTHFFD